jgi:hypothetical protein
MQVSRDDYRGAYSTGEYTLPAILVVIKNVEAEEVSTDKLEKS